MVVSCSNEQDVVRPEYRSITQAVYASGRLYPANYYRVTTKIPGIVQHIYVKAGDTVRRGMPLIAIHSTIADINVAAAANAYSYASENANENSFLINSAKAEYLAAKSKYEYDSVNAARLQRLLNERATSSSSVESALTQVDISRQQLLKAGSSLRSLELKVASERRSAQLQLQAQRSLQRDYTIYAESDGVVYDVFPAVGEQVSPQVTLVEIGDATSFEVELNVDETDIALLVLGQRVVYTIDAFKNRKIEGVVVSVIPRVSAQDKTAKVVASISVSSGAKYLPGMSLEANIITAERTRALVIPRDYLSSDDNVTIIRNGANTTVKVSTGIQDLRYVEITGGLTTSDQLVR